MRILDSKDPRDRPAADSAPKMVLSGEAEDFFGKVREGLDAAGVAYELAPHLVRGLDYYRHTAFEFVTDRLGAQGTVLGGGRYDGLIETLGGPHTPAVGWAAGIERLAMLCEEPPSTGSEIAVIVREGAGEFGTIVAAVLRRLGLSVSYLERGKERVRFERAKAAGSLIAIICDKGAPNEDVFGYLQYRPLNVSIAEFWRRIPMIDQMLAPKFDFKSTPDGEFPVRKR